MAATTSEKSTDKQAALHISQLTRVETLITTVQDHCRHNIYMTKVLWWVCHLVALCSWASGISLAGTSIAKTELADWITPILGIVSAIYPLTKYINLEAARIKYQNMARFSSNLTTRLEDTANRMRGILEIGFDSAREQKRWAEFVVFIEATKKLMEALELGVDNVQTELTRFHEMEAALQTDAAGFPFPAAGAITEANGINVVHKVTGASTVRPTNDSTAKTA